MLVGEDARLVRRAGGLDVFPTRRNFAATDK